MSCCTFGAHQRVKLFFYLTSEKFFLAKGSSNNSSITVECNTKITKGEKEAVEIGTPKVGNWPLHVSLTVSIEAKPEVVWQVLTDYEHLSEFVPGMSKSRVMERNEDTITIEQVFKHLFGSMELLLSVKETPPNRIDFWLVGGNMKIYDGHWLIKPYNSGSTLLTFEVDVQPGFFAPMWLVSWVLKKEIQKGLLAVREEAIKRR